MGAIQFWILRGEERLQLPVNPESITVTSPFGHEDVSVAQLGELTVIGDRLPKEFTFASFFPRDYNPAYCEYTNIPAPWDAVNMIEKFRDTRRQLRLTVTGTPINLHATVRDFTYEPDRAGNPGDIYFSLTLKEFKHVTVGQTQPAASSTTVVNQSKRPATPPATPKTYTVKSGDSLSKIAAMPSIYGDGSKWQKIYDANKSVIGKNPNLIKPGQKLVIPA
jgi:nucleoid-associated protein YgaU